MPHKGPNVPSPTGKSARRAPEKTRRRILAAALQEFSEKGLAGARVNRIAERASINKRMLYHYFGNKKALFRAVLECKLAERIPWLMAAPKDPLEIMPYWFDLICKDTDWIRLLEWEALQQSAGKIVHEFERQASADLSVERVRLGQRRGLLSKAFDARQVALSISALIVFPLAFPQLTRLMTGLLPSDARFQREWSRFLGQFAAAIRKNRRTTIKPVSRKS